MNNIVKFENGKVVFDTSALRLKQRHNVLKLIQVGDLNAALSYTAALSTTGAIGARRRNNRIHSLSDLRSASREGALALANPKKGRIWNMFMQAYNVTHNKPVTGIPYGKAIGIEIEFFMPRQDGGREACGDCGDCEDDRPEDCENMSGGWGLSAARDYFSKLCAERKIKGINLGEDGSIDTDEDENIALEARILTNIDDLSNLEAFCKLLKDVGASVNKSCGLHVHLDFRDYDRRPAAVVGRLAKALPMLKAMVPQTRIDNRYCRFEVGSSSGETGHDRRYAMINDAEAFSKFKTIEVRLHSGTINFVKIKNWVNILYSVARSSHVMAEPTLEGFAAKLGWSASLVAYIVGRIRKFHPDSALLGGSSELGETTDAAGFEEDSEIAA